MIITFYLIVPKDSYNLLKEKMQTDLENLICGYFISIHSDI